MARKINPVPKGYHTSTPVLVVKNAAAAIEFYASVFDAKELSRIVDIDGITILRAELKIGNSIIHLNDEMPAYGILSPTSLGGTSTAVQLYLADIDGAWDRIVEAQAAVILPLEDAYWGERTGKVVDPFGHVWILSKKIENLSKEEIEKRFSDLTALSTLGVADIETPDIETPDIENPGIEPAGIEATNFEIAVQDVAFTAPVSDQVNVPIIDISEALNS
ncbi:VOC family protein [Kiloniella antarctica]|uniref:VOC family protein n=1 Tax=Kiloniella antarctica TaxID=1550907 RepID=A0ABW5BM88_9PROT